MVRSTDGSAVLGYDSNSNRSSRLMNRPTQAEIDTCIKVLDYAIEDTTQNEPWAINSINQLEQVLAELPRSEEDFGEVS